MTIANPVGTSRASQASAAGSEKPSASGATPSISRSSAARNSANDALGFGCKPYWREVVGHRLAPAGRFGDEEHPRRRRLEEALERLQRIGCAALDGHRRQRRGGEPVGVVARELRRVQVEALERLCGEEELLGGEEEIPRREQRPGPVPLQQAEARLRIAPELLDRGVHVVVGDERRLGRQVVEQRAGAVEEERQVVLDPGRRDAVRDVLVDRRFRRVALERLAEPGAEAAPRRVVERELARRQQAHFVHLVHGALRVDVEGAQRVDLVVGELDAVGERAPHREEVDQPAANAVLAGRDDLGDVAVAGGRELGAQPRPVEARALLDEERVAREVRRRRDALQGGRRRHDCDVAVAGRDPVERREPLRHEIVVRREAVVGQGLPVGQKCDAEVGREPRDLVPEALRLERGRADDRQRAARRREACERERVGRAGELPEAGPGHGRSGSENHGRDNSCRTPCIN